MKHLALLLLLILLGTDISQQPDSKPGQDYAVFFVVSQFDRWPSFIHEAYLQVEQIAHELETNYNFDVEIVEDPTKAEILDELEKLSRRPFGPDDQLLLYFSSHGSYERGRKGALIPRDGKKRENDSYSSWITYEQLESYVNRINSEHILLSIDACYSGTFSEKYRGRPEQPPWESESDCTLKINNALEHRSRLYLTSGGIERTPVDSDFARKWIEALTERANNNDGTMSYFALLDVLMEAIPRPISGDFSNHDDGSFIFVRQDACSQSTQERELDFKSFYKGDTKYLYKQIGTNERDVYWLLRNLNVPVPGSESVCYDDDELLCNTYGRLYTWPAAKQACAELGPGWRLPTVAEVKQLALLDGGGYNQLQHAVGDPKKGFENLTENANLGFRAQFGGSRSLKGKYRKKGTDGYYWAASDHPVVAPYYQLDKGKKELILFNGPKEMYFSCRCVREV